MLQLPNNLVIMFLDALRNFRIFFDHLYSSDERNPGRIVPVISFVTNLSKIASYCRSTLPLPLICNYQQNRQEGTYL